MLVGKRFYWGGLFAPIQTSDAVCIATAWFGFRARARPSCPQRTLGHACRCFATPTFPWTGSSDWRPRLSHGIAPQFHRNAMPPPVESRRDGRLEVRDSAAATGHWNCFQPRMNTGERGLWSERLRGRNGLGQANSGGVDSPLIPANYPVQSHRSVDASVFESLTCDSPQ